MDLVVLVECEGDDPMLVRLGDVERAVQDLVNHGTMPKLRLLWLPEETEEQDTRDAR